MSRPQRILVYGVTGTGKTTLARKVSEATGLPLIDVDQLTFRANWETVPKEEQRELFTRLAAQEEWVMDTAYGQWVDVVLPRATLIVGLDYPRWLSLTRLIRRSVARAITKEPVCNGNIETFAKLLSRDSLILWHFKSWARKRARIRAWLAEGRPVVHCKNPQDAERFLRSLS